MCCRPAYVVSLQDSTWGAVLLGAGCLGLTPGKGGAIGNEAKDVRAKPERL